jgi:hypothetical protein
MEVTRLPAVSNQRIPRNDAMESITSHFYCTYTWMCHDFALFSMSQTTVHAFERRQSSS